MVIATIRLGMLTWLLGATTPAPAWAAAKDHELALVRMVSMQMPPPGWLELEEQVLRAARQGSQFNVVPAARAAEIWKVPGFRRIDRARLRIRESISAAATALGEGHQTKALRLLRDVDDLLEIPSVVSAMPASLIRQHHRLEALARQRKGDPKAAPAARRYLALVGVRDDADPDEVASLSRIAGTFDAGDAAGLVFLGGVPTATVFLDGVSLGHPPVRQYDIPPGRHYLRVVAPGQIAHGERLDLEPGQILRRSDRLEGGSDPLRRRGRALLDVVVPAAAIRGLQDLASGLKVGGLLVLVPVPTGEGIYLRHFKVTSASFGPKLLVRFGAPEHAVQSGVDQAMGRLARAPIADASGETIRAVANVGSSPKKPPLLTTPLLGESEQDESVWTSRWLWIGVGAVVITAVVIGIAAAAGGDGGEPGKAQVWICPEGDPCAP